MAWLSKKKDDKQPLMEDTEGDPDDEDYDTSTWWGKYKAFRKEYGPPSQASGEYAAIYESYQSTLQMFMTVATVLMGFVITGAFINMLFAGDATFSQTLLKPFVSWSLASFACALLAVALVLLLSLLGQQCYATDSCFIDAVLFFKLTGSCFLISELLLYLCGWSMTHYIDKFVFLTYMSPSITLCPGDRVGIRGDTFCAQLGNDLFDAAFKDLKECEGKFGVSVVNQRNVAARPFDVSAFATETSRKKAVCNQLDWYVFKAKGGAWSGSTDTGIVKAWFGWDNYTMISDGWTGVPADGNGLTAIQNNGKILGEVMCLKGSTNEKVKALCSDTKAKDYSAEKCAQAQNAYIRADTCAGQKFDDVMKCFHTCSSGSNMKMGYSAMKAKFDTAEWYILWMSRGIAAWMIARIFLWCCFTCFDCFDILEYSYRKYMASLSQKTSPGYYGDDDATAGPIGVTDVTSMTVDKLTIHNKVKPQPKELDVMVEPLMPSQPPPLRQAPPQPLQSKFGVDLNGDGRPDIYYVGKDENRDGIPDLLQGGAFSLADALRRSSEGITTTAAPMTSGYSAMPSTTSVPLTKSFVSRV